MTNTEYEFIGWEALLEVWAPRVLGAVLILIAAWFIGRAIKWALAKGVDKLPGADRHNEGLERRQTVGAKLGDVALWTVLLFGVVAALGVLNLGGAVAPLNTLLNTVAGAIPNIVAATPLYGGPKSTRTCAATELAVSANPLCPIAAAFHSGKLIIADMPLAER